MFNFRNFVLFLTLLTLATATAGASTIITLNFTDLPGQTANGYYVGYSGATVNSIVTPGSPTMNVGATLDLMCDDFTDHTGIPSGPFEYQVTDFSNPNSPTLPSGLAFGSQSGALVKYETAAILLLQFGGLGSSQGALAGDYNFALWGLFTPSAGTYGNSASILAAAQAQQALGVSANLAAYKDLVVFTPTALGTNQEFLGIDTSRPNTQPTPEPATLGMIGIGLLVLGTVGKRRTKANIGK